MSQCSWTICLQDRIICLIIYTLITTQQYEARQVGDSFINIGRKNPRDQRGKDRGGSYFRGNYDYDRRDVRDTIRGGYARNRQSRGGFRHSGNDRPRRWEIENALFNVENSPGNTYDGVMNVLIFSLLQVFIMLELTSLVFHVKILGYVFYLIIFKS